MPLITITSSANPPSAEQLNSLLLGLSKLVAQGIGKPERYVMTCLKPQSAMSFGGSLAPSCFVEVKSIGGLTPAVTEKLCQAVAAELERGLGVPANRTYIEFTDANPALWGFDGSTFG